MEFPKFLYHKEHGARLFQAPADVAAAGDGWVKTPAAFDPAYVPPPETAAPESVPEEALRRGYAPNLYPRHLYRVGEPDSFREVKTADEHAALDEAEPGVWNTTYDPAGLKPSVMDLDDPAHSQAKPLTKTLSDEQKTQFLASNVATIVKQLDAVTDPATLDALQAVEATREGGARTTVAKAIAARRNLLAAA